MDRKGLMENIWAKAEYYRAISSEEDFSHPGFKKAVKYCCEAKRILDVGCGDGSKLSRLGGERTLKTGCDVSKEAVILGKQLYSNINFDRLKSNTLPYKNESFDRVTSFFVLEHTDHPEELILEMVRVLEVNGELILLAPNFGAPNRASPNFHQSRLGKLVVGFIKDLLARKGLGWVMVIPKIEKIDQFDSDLDTTIEPYLGSLIRFIRDKRVEIVEAESFWEMEKPKAKLWQKGFRILGEWDIFPFKYWGPHLFIVARKL